MIENFYPNPIVVQRLQAGPLSAHIDTFAQRNYSRPIEAAFPARAI